MEVVEDGAAAKIKEVLAGATVASAVSLPAADVGQAMLDRHSFPQLGSTLRRQLSFAQLLQEPFIRVDVDAAAMGARRAACPEGTDLALLLGEVHGAPDLEGNDDLIRTADGVLLPVQGEGGLGVAITVADRPSLAVNDEIIGAMAYELTGQVATIEVDLPELDLLVGEIRHDWLGHRRRGHIGRGESHRPNEPGVQVPEDMAFGAIEPVAATLPSVPHLAVLHPAAPILGHATTQLDHIVREVLDILVPPLLTSDHTQGLAQGVSQEVIRIFHPACSPERTTIQGGTELSTPDRLGLGGQLHRPFDQSPIELVCNEPLAEGKECALAKRGMLDIQAVQDHLPASVHHGGFDHLIITGTGIGLQDGGQGQLCRWHRRVTERTVLIERAKLRLEGVVEQLMSVLAQEDEHLGALDEPQDRLFGR